MITKAQLLTIAGGHQLLPNVIQKDYVIGWVLFGISKHKKMSQWLFKGGTCLKKCYFNQYRFSQDLDFTIPKKQALNTKLVKKYLLEITSWVESRSGLTFPQQNWKIEEYQNSQDKTSFQVKISYLGPLGAAPRSLPKIKFDLTQNELIVNPPELHQIYHNFPDKFSTTAQINCYSLEEILAEKIRALVERQGRARDVYDLVNIYQHFKNEVNPQLVKSTIQQKFAFKNLEMPTTILIMKKVDAKVLKANWEHQLAHQINELPAVKTYIQLLPNVLKWILK